MWLRPASAGLDDTALAEPARTDAGGSAGDYPSLAPGGLQGVLALEVAKEGRAAEDRSWSARAHSTDEPGKPDVGSAPDPWGAVDARLRGRSVHGLEIHAAGWASVARLEDVLAQPRAGHCRH